MKMNLRTRDKARQEHTVFFVEERATATMTLQQPYTHAQDLQKIKSSVYHLRGEEAIIDPYP